MSRSISSTALGEGEAGLVESSRSGPPPEPAALGDALDPAERVGGDWNERLRALRNHLTP